MAHLNRAGTHPQHGAARMPLRSPWASTSIPCQSSAEPTTPLELLGGNGSLVGPRGPSG
jgi:hypothetical protein